MTVDSLLAGELIQDEEQCRGVGLDFEHLHNLLRWIADIYMYWLGETTLVSLFLSLQESALRYILTLRMKTTYLSVIARE